MLSATLLVGVGWPSGVAQADEPEFTQDFRLGDCWYSSRGGYPYFPLKPGLQLTLVGEDEGEELVLVVTVLHQTRWIKVPIDGKNRWVPTRVVREKEFVDGELLEVSWNYFARCRQTNAGYYWGEDVDIFENGDVLHDGAWLAGQDGALPGLMMPGTFLLGARYFQEVAPGVAMDRGENVGMGVTMETDAGTFTDCVEVEDTNALEPDAEGDLKVYCPGIGLTADEDAELTEIEMVDG
jgi:hypothetical protein